MSRSRTFFNPSTRPLALELCAHPRNRAPRRLLRDKYGTIAIQIGSSWLHEAVGNYDDRERRDDDVAHHWRQKHPWVATPCSVRCCCSVPYRSVWMLEARAFVTVARYRGRSAPTLQPPLDADTLVCLGPPSLVLVVSNYAPFSVPHHPPASIQDRICVPCAIRVLPSRSPPIATGRARPTPMATLIDDFSQSMGTAIPFSSPGCRPRLSLSLTAQSRST
ncbi:hypothetical protein DFH06DRAFT_1320152 [Mycena polygramma]|nr:hypothetical protein DFH06DRAFT_1320152 [Mycena polygramma]